MQLEIILDVFLSQVAPIINAVAFFFAGAIYFNGIGYIFFALKNINC